MTHYIHAPHKRNFAERPKKNTQQWRLWFYNYSKSSLRQLGIKSTEPATMAKGKWIDKKDIYNQLSKWCYSEV